MNIAFQRAVDHYVGVPVCAALSLWHRLFGRAAGGPPQRAILVILLSEMGSLVLAEPMFARLRARYPEARIHVLLFARNREMLELLGVVPPGQVHTLDDRSLGGLLADAARVLWRLRALELDAVLDCELFSRVSSILAYLSGARLRAGFHRHTQEGLYRGSFINRPVLYNPYRHLSLQLLSLVTALESTGAPLAKQPLEPTPAGPPHLEFSPGEREQAAARLQEQFPAVAHRRLVLVYPGGGLLPIRAWPLECFVQLCAGLLADGFAVGVVGLADDRPLAQQLVARCASERCLDLTGYTKSIRHLLALFHRAELLIANDGGPGQFAALTPITSIVLFGPETPLLYRSLSTNAHCFHLALPCSPCLTAYNHRSSPCDGDNLCLKLIPPAQVLATARALLAPASAAAPA